MLKRIAKFIADHIANEPWMILPCIMYFVLFIVGFSGFMFHLDSSIDYQMSLWNFLLTLLLLVCPVAVLIFRALDKLIEYTSSAITDGDIKIQNFFLRHVFGNCERYKSTFRFRKTPFDSYIQVGFVMGMIPLLATLSINFIVYFPWLLMIPGLFVIYIVFIKLAQKVYRIKKRLNNHMNDPDAHKQENAE